MNKFSFQRFVAFAGAVIFILASSTLHANAEEASNRISREQLRLFVEVYSATKQIYVDPVDDKKLMEGVLRGLLSGLDPNSSYLDAEEFKELQVSNRDASGVGLEIDNDEGNIKVLYPVEGGPAEKAGLRAGDLIIKIDGIPTQTMSLSLATRKLRGAVGSSVSLTILRQTSIEPFEVALQRQIIKEVNVRSAVIEPGYGYIRISTMRFAVVKELALHLNNLYKQGELKGLVLDVRDNSGGLLAASVGIAAAFLPPDVSVVSITGRREGQRTLLASPKEYAKSGTDFLSDLPLGTKTVPLVVLVNRSSISGTEIMAGALQDHKRAVIMGESTFGQATIQTLFPLPSGGAIKFSTDYWQTPNGNTVAGIGITPDIKISASPVQVSYGNATDQLVRQAFLYLKNSSRPANMPMRSAARQ